MYFISHLPDEPGLEMQSCFVHVCSRALAAFNNDAALLAAFVHLLGFPLSGLQARVDLPVVIRESFGAALERKRILCIGWLPTLPHSLLQCQLGCGVVLHFLSSGAGVRALRLIRASDFCITRQ